MTPEFSFEAQLLSAAGGLIAPVESCNLTADSGWAPRFQANVVATLTPQLLTAEVVRLQLRRMGGRALSLADWTAKYGGTTAGLTAQGGTSTSAITAGLGGTQYTPESTRPAPQEINLTMLVRDIEVDEEAGTATVTLGSYEVELQEILNLAVSTGGVEPSGFLAPAEQRVAIPAFLAAVVPGAEVVTNQLPQVGNIGGQGPGWVPYDKPPQIAGIPTSPTTPLGGYPVPSVTMWQLGESAYDFLAFMLDEVGALWTEDGRAWHATTPEQLYATKVANAASLYVEKVTPRYTPRKGKKYTRITRYIDPKPVDDGGGSTFILKQTLIEGPQGAHGGVYREQVAKLSLSSPGIVTRPSPKVPPVQSGVKLEAVADFTLRPEWRLDYTHHYDDPALPDHVINTGQIKTLRWQYPEGTMSVDIEARGSSALPPKPPIY